MPLTLEKGDAVKLEKDPGEPALNHVVLGLGWDPAPGTGKVDLDASVILIKGGQVSDIVSFRNLRARGIEHTGDNRTGEGEGDDEQIKVTLSEVDADALVAVVLSYEGHTFDQVANAYCRLLDGDEELLRYSLGAKESTTGVLMAKLVKDDSGVFKMTALGDFQNGRVAEDFQTAALAAVA